MRNVQSSIIKSIKFSTLSKNISKPHYYLHLIVPTFASNKNIEQERIKAFRKWRIDKFEKITSKLKVKPNYLFGYCGDEERSGRVVKRYGKGTTKGKLVREKISNILTQLKNVSKNKYERTFIVLIDGTGRIDYNSIINILKSLISGEEVVLGCRKGKFAISRQRKSIELFENFLVSEKYKIYLPDGQCGCWGFRLTAKKNLTFDSEKYSVEIELLINSLANNIDICFAPVKTIHDIRTSGFKLKDNFDKLNFIAKTLDIDRFDLEAKYIKFRKEKRLTLPPSYTTLFKKIKSMFLKRIRCKNKCDIKCFTHINKIKNIF